MLIERKIFMEQIKELLARMQKPRILDVGTGVGNFIAMLLENLPEGASIVGIDQSQRMIDIAKKQFQEYPQVSFQMMDGESMDFPEESFDVVCLSNSLHHLGNPEQVFSEMKRVLKQDGYILVNEMMKNHLSPAQTSHVLIHHFAAEIDRLMGMIHDETYDREDIIQRVQQFPDLELVDVWDMVFEGANADPMQGLDVMIQTLDKLVERVKSREDASVYIEKAEAIKKHLHRYGILGATQLLLTLQKRRFV